ncbi:hypothetical protein TrST_g1703 [Triparma strigata]|uniref:Uncharacterized protein n=1 Tax=Triparma strigata TaxID=1606541 RepID=A0A9W6ZNK2_9STRA|nr:hypothetical protein TrST_g1703 [Triparma strigata]
MSSDEESFVIVTPNPQGSFDEEEDDQSNPELDYSMVSETLTESEVEPSDDETEHIVLSPALSRSMAKQARKFAPRGSGAAPRDFLHPQLSRHKQLSAMKRSASAPCRVPLTLPPRAPRRAFMSPVPDNSDSEASEASNVSEVSETSMPAPYTPGALSYNPNDDDSPQTAMLRNRVDRIRALKLDGKIVSYVDRRARRGKSIVEKLSKDQEALKLFAKGGVFTSTSTSTSPVPPSPSQSLTVEQRLQKIPANLLGVVRRLVSTPSADQWEKIEEYMAAVFSLPSSTLSSSSSSSDTPALPLPSPPFGIATTVCTTQSARTKLSFLYPPKGAKDTDAFVRIFIHALSHFHGLNSRSYVHKKKKLKVLDVTAPPEHQFTPSFLKTIVNEQIIEERN